MADDKKNKIEDNDIDAFNFVPDEIKIIKKVKHHINVNYES